MARLHYAYEDNNKICFLQELVSGGNLFDRLLYRKKYSELQAALLMKNLLKLLQYLEDKNIIHRDIKFENILLVNDIDDYNIKLVDFGFANKTSNIDLKFACGTPGYIAPEVLKGINCDFKSGICSAGIVLYAL